MILLLIAVVVGLSAGLARARVGVHAPRARLRHVWLLGAGAVLHAASAIVDGDAATTALGFALLTLVSFTIVNPTVTGIAVIGLGLFVNLTSLVVNNGVPVRPEALVAAGAVERDELATFELRPPRHLESQADRFAALGEVLPIGFARQVVSFGDLIVVVGVADAARELARRRSRRWSDDERAGYAALTTLASADHDWGTAPSGAPVSATQCSANPDVDTPAIIDLDREADAPASPDLVTASHSR